MDLLFFILSASGLVLILNKSSLFKPLRNYISSKPDTRFWWFLNSIFGCSMCMAVWVSIPVYFIGLSEYRFVLYAFVGSACAYMITVLTELWARK